LRSFEAFAKEHLPQKLLPVDEFLELRKQWLAERNDGDDPEAIEERQKEEVVALRDKVIEARKAVHKATVKAVADRWTFEEAVSNIFLPSYLKNISLLLFLFKVLNYNYFQIKRPYFHVKPLEKGQLKNWKDYLEYEIEQGERARIIVLFERCLIACALYDEYWIKVSNLCLRQA
jgi:pre-mRNA-processing factor 39